MRVMLMGSSNYAVRVLEGMVQVLAPSELRVVSQPDRPQGRGHHVRPSPVSAYALAQQIALDRPRRLADLRAEWMAYRPDVIVTAAYGRILPPWLVNLPRRAVNLHASLLPRWRGPNPIGWAIWAGDEQTGVTLMEMQAGIDTGPILAAERLAIRGEDTFTTLEDRLSALARDLWLRCWAKVLDLPAHPQLEDGATDAPKFDPAMRQIDWTRPAVAEARRIRSMSDRPGAYTMWDTFRIGVGPARVLDLSMEAGVIRMDREAWIVGCGTGALYVDRIRPAGKSWMTPGAFCRGLRGRCPERLK